MKYALLALVGLLCVAGTAEARIFGRRARVNVVVGGHAQAVVAQPVVVRQHAVVQQQVVKQQVVAQPVVVQQVQAVHAAPVIVQPAQVVVPAYQFFAR